MKSTVTLFLVLVATILLSVDARPESKPDYSKAPGKVKIGQKYAKYDTYAINVKARDNITRQEWTSYFYPRVDEFTVLELMGSWNQSAANGGNITNKDTEPNTDTSVNEFRGTPGSFVMVYNPNLTIWLEFPNHPNLTKIEPRRLYSTELREGGGGRLVSYFSVIVLLDKGNITQYSWDEGCHECNKLDCLDNVTCTVDRWHGGEDRCLKTDCNIQIYIGWMGRDKDDAACRSSSSLPSTFSKYSIQSIQNFGNGLFDDVIYGFTENAPNPVTPQA